MIKEQPELTYIVVLIVAMTGGAITYLRSLDENSKFAWRVFALRLLVSGFAGVLAYWLGASIGLTWPALAAVTGIAGSMGDRFLDSLEDALPSVLIGKATKK